MSASLETRGVEVVYGRHHAVRGVDLRVSGGQVVALLGPNGAGKSSLVKALVRAVPVAGGSVRADGVELDALSPRRRARLLGYLPQENTVELGFTVGDLVRLGRYPHLGRWRSPGPGDRAAVRRAMERAGVAGLAGRTVPTLSGGQRQLVMLAKVLAQETGLVLLDEPVSALDPYHQLVVLGLLTELAADGVGVVVVLHDLNLAARFAERLVLMRDGVVVAAGPPGEVLTVDLLRTVYRVDAHVGTDPSTGALQVTPLCPSVPIPQESPCPVPVA